jgi:Cu/Ag efflux pump CusA
VDDAIIDVENIQRRLGQNALRATPKPRLSVVLNASLEVRSAVVYATLIVVLVFLPVYFMEGLSGAFFRPLAIAYVLAVSASLVVAIVVTPALSLILLPQRPQKRGHGVIERVLVRFYQPLVQRMVGKTRLAGLGFVLSIGAALAVVPFLGEAFLPDFHETDFLMHWVGRPGTSVEEMDRITIRASRELRAIPGVRNFGSHIGRAEVADEVVGQNFAELWISLDEKADYATSVAKIQTTVDGYPGLYRDVQTYLQERMKEVLTGGSGAIVVRIYGPDLGTLRAKGEDLRKALKDVPGVSNLKVEPQVLVPQIEVALDAAALQRFGLTPADVRRTMATLLQGTRVGEVYRGDQVVEVVVWGDDKLRSDVTAVRELRIASGGTAIAPPPVAAAHMGGAAVNATVSPDVRLGDLATVDIVPAPNVVQRESASRRLDVTCDARGRDLGAVARDVERAVRGVAFPAGHHAEVLGEYAAREKARSRLLGLTALSLLGIALVLYADFRSARTAAFLMATLPFALVGGVLGVWLTGGVVSLGSLVGFVTVLGIAARNGILLVGHFRHLETEEGMAFGAELVVRGAAERAVPILMTALATGLALVPLVVSGNRPGNEIEYPMAVVILGGLITSTALNLLLVPALYLRVGRSARAPEDAATGDDAAALA